MHEHDHVIEALKAAKQLGEQRKKTRQQLSDRVLDALKIIIDNNRLNEILLLAKSIEKEDFITRQINNEAPQIDPDKTYKDFKLRKISNDRNSAI